MLIKELMINNKAWMEIFKRKVIVNDSSDDSHLEISCEAIAMRYLSEYHKSILSAISGKNILNDSTLLVDILINET